MFEKKTIHTQHIKNYRAKFKKLKLHIRKILKEQTLFALTTARK